jgi:hypothetical protein
MPHEMWPTVNKQLSEAANQLLSRHKTSYIHTYIHIYSYITPLTRVLTEKILVAQLLKKLSAFYRIRRSIVMLINARHWSLSSAR